MKDVIIYNEFIASVHYSSDDEVFFGKIEGITDLVTFEGTSVQELQSAFHEAVDDSLRFVRKMVKRFSNHIKVVSIYGYHQNYIKGPWKSH